MKICIFAGDERNAYLSAELRARGIDHDLLGHSGEADLAGGLGEYELVVGPVPLSRDGKTLHAPRAKASIPIGDFIAGLSPAALLAAGSIPADFVRMAADRGFRHHDLTLDPELYEANLLPTCEGIVLLLLEGLKVTLSGSSILLLGYGRLGKPLAALLARMGARVSLFAKDALPGASFPDGVAAIPSIDKLGPFDAVVNTVPALLLDGRRLATLREGAFIVDAASFPGGVVAGAAEALGSRYVRALGLPGKKAPATVGKNLARAVIALIGETGASRVGGGAPAEEDRGLPADAISRADSPAGVAILGFGTMGKMLFEKIAARQGLARAKGSTSRPIVVANRSPERLTGLASRPGLRVAASFAEAVLGAEHVFLCAKPAACVGILKEIGGLLPPETHLISIAADLPLTAIETLIPCKVSRLMPTLAAEKGRGYNLLVPGRGVGPGDIAELAEILGNEVKLEAIEESEMDILTGITSCGPGLYATILEEFLKAATEEGNLAAGAAIDLRGLEPGQALRLLRESLYGTLALAEGMDFRELRARVATPGGVTGAGAAVLQADLPATFARMFAEMGARHRARAGEIAALIEGAGK